MNYEEERRYVSFCGAYCRICDSFTGKKQGVAQTALTTIEKRESEFEELFQDELVMNSIIRTLTRQASWRCPGCKALVDDPTIGYICRIRQCCSSKNLDLCSECEEFPCQSVSNHRTVTKLHGIENLMEIREKGIESWLDRRWEEFTKSQDVEANLR